MPTFQTYFRRGLILALIVFFVVGGLGNLIAPQAVQEDYARWGFPSWFHFLTGTLEIIAAALLAIRRSRGLGILLGCAVMLAALSTLLLHAEFSHSVAPAMVLVLISFLAVGERRSRC